MLLANEAVAARLMARNQGAIYRVHEEPNELRLQEYREEVLSHNIPCGDLKKRTEVQKLLQRLNQIPIGPALKIGFLKSLMRARYAAEPLGHYGLQKRNILISLLQLDGTLTLSFTVPFSRISLSPENALKQAAEHISDTERNSADAERDSKDLKLFAFLKAQLDSGNPQIYPALVTDVRNFGFFVDVPDLTMSGLVPVSTMEEDFYIFDPDQSCLIGRRTRKVIRLGDNIQVQVAKVDSFKSRSTLVGRGKDAE